VSLATSLRRLFGRRAPIPHPRVISYSPRRNRQADPGEIVWTNVAFEDDPSVGKDRPVLVIGTRGRRQVAALMLSTQPHRSGQRHWMPIGTGEWDARRRPSYVRLDRVLTLPAKSIRREAAALDRQRFAAVAAKLRAEYGWTW
jgi:hypothetical protein